MSNVVTVAEAAIASRLCDDLRVRVVSVTASTEIARIIAARCASIVKHLVMELGSKCDNPGHLATPYSAA